MNNSPPLAGYLRLFRRYFSGLLSHRWRSPIYQLGCSGLVCASLMGYSEKSWAICNLNGDPSPGKFTLDPTGLIFSSQDNPGSFTLVCSDTNEVTIEITSVTPLDLITKEFAVSVADGSTIIVKADQGSAFPQASPPQTLGNETKTYRVNLALTNASTLIPAGHYRYIVNLAIVLTPL